MRAPTEPHLVFDAGGTCFAVPASLASEIVTVTELMPIPGAPRHVQGLLAHRGEVSPVVDLQALLGAQEAPARIERAVLVRTAGGLVAFAVRRVDGVGELRGDAERLAPEGARSHFAGPFESPSGAVTAIDAETLVAFLSHRTPTG